MKILFDSFGSCVDSGEKKRLSKLVSMVLFDSVEWIILNNICLRPRALIYFSFLHFICNQIEH